MDFIGFILLRLIAIYLYYYCFILHPFRYVYDGAWSSLITSCILGFSCSESPIVKMTKNIYSKMFKSIFTCVIVSSSLFFIIIRYAKDENGLMTELNSTEILASRVVGLSFILVYIIFNALNFRLIKAYFKYEDYK